MTDRARELVERARRYRKDNLRETSIGYALFGELADFIEQSLTPPEGDTVSEGVVEQFLEELDGWERAYPLSAFPEPDLAKAAALLKAGGMTLDAVSASNMRHVVSQIAPRAREAIAALQSRVSPQVRRGEVMDPREEARIVTASLFEQEADAVEKLGYADAARTLRQKAASLRARSGEQNDG